MSTPGLSSSSSSAGDNRLEATRKQVEDVQNIMRENVSRVLERDAKLSSLEDRADRLHEGTEQFQRTANRVKRKQFWANMKMKIIIGVVVAVIVIIILVWIFA